MNWDELGSTGVFSITPPKRGFYVYIAWGADRTRPLYIGRAVNLWRRFEQHAQWKAQWVAEVVELECRAFPSAEMAESAERDAILEMNPIHNHLRWANLRRRRAA